MTVLSMKRLRSIGLVCLLMCLTLFTFSSPVLADSWHYDFSTGEDLSALTVVNPTGAPTLSIVDPPGAYRLYIPNNAAYDLASWINLNAPRAFRNVANEAFTLETKLDTTFTTYTFLSGLFLYNSATGIGADDLIFGASSNSLKIDQGYPTNHSGSFAWTGIGSYPELYLKVEHDGSGNYDFSYKLSDEDPWYLHTSLSGYSFDYLGVITKTWNNPSYGYPQVTADYDYLYYNYTPAPVPVPPAVLLLGSGLIGLLGIRRKIRDRKQ